jgi:hypothetical protein
VQEENLSSWRKIFITASNDDDDDDNNNNNPPQLQRLSDSKWTE